MMHSDSASTEGPSENTLTRVPELSAVMPAYNEEEVLPEVLEETTSALDRFCDRWELVVVDDGSTDRTPEILAEWAARDERVRVVTQTPNQGYTKALIRGFESTRHLAIFYTDADGQFDPLEIPRLYAHLGAVHMVAGYRENRQDPWFRLLTSAVYNRLQAWALGLKVRDVNCAFKIFRRSFFEMVELGSDGFLIDAELYARAKKAGLSWIQVGVTHRPREQGSTTVKLSTITETLRELRRLKRSLKA